MMAEGTHWLPRSDPFDIAWKLVATNLSDLAAKGAEPVGIILGHTLGEGDDRFFEGLHAILSQYHVPLLGGDTIKAEGPRTLGLTAIGRATHTPVPSRSGAQVGDDIFVCGLIGDAMAGLEELKKIEWATEKDYDLASIADPDPYFVEAFLRPKPLLEEGQHLAPLVTAMMDVSDGLYLDATRIAKASEVTLDIRQDAVPHSDQLRERASQGNLVDVGSKGWPMRTAACQWGDDYALLFTAPNHAQLPLECTRIGSVRAKTDQPLLVDGKAPPVTDLGWLH